MPQSVSRNINTLNSFKEFFKINFLVHFLITQCLNMTLVTMIFQKKIEIYTTQHFQAIFASF
jgi:hypothetical protein